MNDFRFRTTDAGTVVSPVEAATASGEQATLPSVATTVSAVSKQVVDTSTLSRNASGTQPDKKRESFPAEGEGREWNVKNMWSRIAADVFAAAAAAGAVSPLISSIDRYVLQIPV
jgi:hypothetical protein